jgi:hypothetical protein
MPALAAALMIATLAGCGGDGFPVEVDKRAELGESVQLLPEEAVGLRGTEFVVRSLGGRAVMLFDEETDDPYEIIDAPLEMIDGETTTTLIIEYGDSAEFQGYVIEVTDIQPWIDAAVELTVTSLP